MYDVPAWAICWARWPCPVSWTGRQLLQRPGLLGKGAPGVVPGCEERFLARDEVARRPVSRSTTSRSSWLAAARTSSDLPRPDRRVAQVGDGQKHDREGDADDEGQPAGGDERPTGEPRPPRTSGRTLVRGLKVRVDGRRLRPSRRSRMARVERCDLEMKPAAGLAATRSARSSAVWIEMRISCGDGVVDRPWRRPTTSNPLSGPRSTSTSTDVRP